MIKSMSGIHAVHQPLCQLCIQLAMATNRFASGTLLQGGMMLQSAMLCRHEHVWQHT